VSRTRGAGLRENTVDGFIGSAGRVFFGRKRLAGTTLGRGNDYYARMYIRRRRGKKTV